MIDATAITNPAMAGWNVDIVYSIHKKMIPTTCISIDLNHTNTRYATRLVDEKPPHKVRNQNGPRSRTT